MVSIRKRRHLGIQERYKILSQLSRLNAHQMALESKAVMAQNSNQAATRASSETTFETKPVIVPQWSSPFLDAGSSKDTTLPVKSRKLSRRKQAENQDSSCMLRGVYYKNLKWQAAIKVEKKQIHLGTVASMEEAAHLYDRAAYLCGRVPNFELSEQEKQELHGLHWDKFLLMTKEAIASKKKQKRIETCMRRRQTTAEGEDCELDMQSFYQFEPESYRQPGSFDEHMSFHRTATYPETPPFSYSTSYHPISFPEPAVKASSPIHLHSIH